MAKTTYILTVTIELRAAKKWSRSFKARHLILTRAEAMLLGTLIRRKKQISQVLQSNPEQVDEKMLPHKIRFKLLEFEKKLRAERKQTPDISDLEILTYKLYDYVFEWKTDGADFVEVYVLTNPIAA